MSLFKLIHLLAALIWVGGMFFAYMVLRPVSAEVLQAPQRLQLWDKVFSCFFKYVWGAIFFMLASGLYMLHLYGGMANTPYFAHIMLLSGCLMVLIFVYVFFGLYPHFTRAVAANDWSKAGGFLAAVRKFIASNLLIGIATFAVVAFGRTF
mgnify:FL=1